MWRGGATAASAARALRSRMFPDAIHHPAAALAPIASARSSSSAPSAAAGPTVAEATAAAVAVSQRAGSVSDVLRHYGRCYFELSKARLSFGSYGSSVTLRLDIIDFFLKNMISENLGKICNAHVVHADLSEYGAMDEKCIHLAELAATAVDFPKTGKLAIMPQHLKPKVYPDFMGKEDAISYKSEKILGRLYWSIQEASNGDVVSEELCTSNDLPYDIDLEVPGASDFLASAWQCKCSYEAQLSALLNQYRVRTETELVTGHITSITKYNSKKQVEIKERLKYAYSVLRKEFRSTFESIASDQCELAEDEKNLLYEMKASAWYQVTYHPKWVEKSIGMLDPDGEEMPARLSFAWIPVDYLARIKLKCHGKVIVEGQRPVERLAAYIAERIC
ncbi:hypothetical protein E2562_037788 [Oryza meyeriana var. granulata]|uniref:RNA-dependent RNA polymerase n=1 Tax=Oryza meyeriana var. granulata TaxID=110450 RepID=A0A6G1E8F3_9ORYZ|nr:hypothetical protein E2562_037788 [Oryza meyeriana var. granulata]